MGVSEMNGMKLRKSEDNMEAFLTLTPNSDNQPYTLEALMAFLQSQKIVVGIDEEALKRMIRVPLYQHEVCVARGIDPINGRDGVITYNFNTEINQKPTIREDGSVDYWSMHTVELVSAGQVIATYEEPTDPIDGINLSGARVPAKRGKPLPPLRGKGFSCSEDGLTYTADVSGKIEIVGGRIQISKVYEIPGDVGIETGNIDFHGDVVIHGNVTPGASVKSTGNIVVDGVCENCMLDAGKDILLRGGVLGGNKAVIRSRGSIHAKFFEYCQVQADGMIEAEFALDSHMVSYDRICLSGKKANIVGGYAYATSGIVVNTLGNHTEIKTEIHVGASADMMKALVDAQKLMAEASSTVQKITQGLKQYDEMAAEKGIDVSQDIRRVALFRTRMIKQSEEATYRKEMQKLLGLIEKSKGAGVCVLHDVFPGTVITVDRSTNTVKEQQNAVKFIKRKGNVVMQSLADVFV